MTIKRTLGIITAIAIILCAFTGCGAANKDFYISDNAMMESTDSFDGGWYDSDWTVEEEAVMEEIEFDEKLEVMAPVEAPTTSGNVDADSLPQSERKIIKNKSLELQTTDLATFVTELKRQVNLLGGYIENSSNYKSSAEFTLRIPAQNYDAFSTVVGNLATITFENEYVDDVTSQYIDIEARLTALRSEQESYLRLMEKAETIDEILQIQSYLSNVNYQIESYTAQLNSYKSKISYSTIRVTAIEVQRVTNVIEKPTVFERISSNLSDNLYDITESAKDMFVGVVSALPYLAIWAVTILIIVIIVKLCIKKYRKSEAKRAAAEAQKNEQK